MRIVYSRNWPIGPLPKSAPSQIVRMYIEAFLFKKGSPRVLKHFCITRFDINFPF